MSAIVSVQTGLYANSRSAVLQTANHKAGRSTVGTVAASVDASSPGAPNPELSKVNGPKADVVKTVTASGVAADSSSTAQKPLVYRRSAIDAVFSEASGAVLKAASEYSREPVRDDAILGSAKTRDAAEGRMFMDDSIVLEPYAIKTLTERTAVSAYAQADKAIYFSGDFHSPVVGVDIIV